MGVYIQDSIKQISDKLKAEKNVVIKVETSSGSPEARRIKIVNVQDDYIVGHERNTLETENFSFAHITNWKFVNYDPKEWKQPEMK